MHAFLKNPYDEISTQTLELLAQFSQHILVIEDNINQLLIRGELNQNVDFLDFITHFRACRYYHFGCEGYMASLVLAKCYSPLSICYWKNSLLESAIESFTEALAHLDRLKKLHHVATNNTFQEMLLEIDDFIKVSEEIQETIKLYNLEC